MDHGDRMDKSALNSTDNNDHSDSSALIETSSSVASLKAVGHRLMTVKAAGRPWTTVTEWIRVH